ncbi:MAG: AmmeMemoRadiSam system protein B [Anaerolineae bacterium]|nr:AmmeMemoRadiSam system protein B [Anaerolineae bacterium]
MSAIPDVRLSPIAGTWYPGEPEALRQQIEARLQSAILPDLPGDVVALVAPHAGYRYSGHTAAHAFRAVLGNSYDMVAVVSPFHRYPPASMLTSAHAAYETPLGRVPVDRAALNALDLALQERNMPALQPLARDQEHSLEIQLPFLQCVLADEFQLLPVMLATHEAAALHHLGDALAQVIGERRALLVASTDLSHFYPLSVARSLDTHILERMALLQPQAVLEADRSGAGQACGAMAVAAVLWAALDLGATQAIQLHYSTSADGGAGEDSVVGYGALAILKPGASQAASQ